MLHSHVPRRFTFLFSSQVLSIKAVQEYVSLPMFTIIRTHLFNLCLLVGQKNVLLIGGIVRLILTLSFKINLIAALGTPDFGQARCLLVSDKPSFPWLINDPPRSQASN
jgi:hypothetical protein